MASNRLDFSPQPHKGWGTGLGCLISGQNYSLRVHVPDGTPPGTTVYLVAKAPNRSQPNEIPAATDPELFRTQGNVDVAAVDLTINTFFIPLGIEKAHFTLFAQLPAGPESWACGFLTVRRDGVHGHSVCAEKPPFAGQIIAGDGVSFTDFNGALVLTLHNSDGSVKQSIKIGDLLDFANNLDAYNDRLTANEAQVVSLEAWKSLVDSDGDGCVDCAEYVRTDAPVDLPAGPIPDPIPDEFSVVWGDPTWSGHTLTELQAQMCFDLDDTGLKDDDDICELQIVAPAVEIATFQVPVGAEGKTPYTRVRAIYDGGLYASAWNYLDSQYPGSNTYYGNPND